MTIVGGIPAVDIVALSRNTLSTGSTMLAEITVSALSNGGPIRVETLPIKVGLTNATLDGNFSVKIGTTSIATTGTAAGSGEKVITLSAPYTIAPGESAKFEIYANVATAPANSTISTELGNRADFLWTDVEGNVLGNVSGGVNGLNGTLVSDYSTNKTSVWKNF